MTAEEITGIVTAVGTAITGIVVAVGSIINNKRRGTPNAKCCLTGRPLKPKKVKAEKKKQ